MSVYLVHLVDDVEVFWSVEGLAGNGLATMPASNGRAPGRRICEVVVGAAHDVGRYVGAADGAHVDTSLGDEQRRATERAFVERVRRHAPLLWAARDETKKRRKKLTFFFVMRYARAAPSLLHDLDCTAFTALEDDVLLIGTALSEMCLRRKSWALVEAYWEELLWLFDDGTAWSAPARNQNMIRNRWFRRTLLKNTPPGRRRTSYTCRVCGENKRGHVCRL